MTDFKPDKTASAAPTRRSFLSAAQILLAVTVLCTVSMLVKVGCDRARIQSRPNSGLPIVEMQVGDEKFTLEIANTFETRERGLMQRDSMPDDWGMIFVFAAEEDRNFWMKNTRIPLDILYLAGDGKIVSIKTMQPYSLKNTPSDGPAKYAIELNAGIAAKSGVKPGDTVRIPESAREPIE